MYVVRRYLYIRYIHIGRQPRAGLSETSEDDDDDDDDGNKNNNDVDNNNNNNHATPTAIYTYIQHMCVCAATI
jgi:hypothetical protein